MNSEKTLNRCLCFGLILVISAFSFGCSTVDVTVLGVFKKSLPETTIKAAPEETKAEEAAGIFLGGIEDGAILSGQIISEDNTHLPGAQVSFLRIDWTQESDHWTSFEADAEGRFQIRGVAAGRYRIAGLFPRYHMRVLPFIEVQAKEEVEDILIILKKTH